MAKSFIDVVQDSPRAGLGIPVKTKKPPLSNQYTTHPGEKTYRFHPRTTRTAKSTRDAG